MKSALTSFLVGFIFAIGLGIAGMTQPAKIIGFLDVFGAWDPTLVFVMLGAIAVHLVTYKFIRKKKTPLLSKAWHVPTSRDITPSLISGSVLFGIGWALGGYCPGPAITSLASLQLRPLIFVISMIFGMLVFRLVDKKLNFKK